MKKIFALAFGFLFSIALFAQPLPKDIQKVYDKAEKYTKKGDYDRAVSTYKEVLRSVEHIKSCINIGDIEMKLRARPNYRPAYEYYERALSAINQGISQTNKNSVKKYLTKLRDETIPKRNKAKSHVQDFDNAKQLKEGGQRLLDDPDLKD